MRDQPVYQYHDKHPVRYLQLLDSIAGYTPHFLPQQSPHTNWPGNGGIAAHLKKLSHCIQVHLRILLTVTGPYRKKKWCDNDPPTIGCQKSKLCVPFGSKAFPTSPVHLCHPLHRIADASAVPVEGRRTWVPGLRFPFAVCKIIKGGT